MFSMAKEWSFRSQGIPKTNYNEDRYRSYVFFKSFTWSRRCFLPLKDSELSKRWKGKFSLPPFRLHSVLEIHIHSFYDAELPSCIQTRFFHETWLVCCRGFGAPKYVIIFVYSDWLAEGKDWRHFFAPFLKLPCRQLRSQALLFPPFSMKGWSIQWNITKQTGIFCLALVGTKTKFCT